MIVINGRSDLLSVMTIYDRAAENISSSKIVLVKVWVYG